MGQARKATMALRQRFHMYEFSAHEKYDLYLKMIEPILSYGSEVWGDRVAREIEVMHKSFIKEILGVRRSTKNTLIYAELATVSLRARREIKMITTPNYHEKLSIY